MLQIAPQVELYGLFGGLSLHPIIGLDIGIPLSTSESRYTTINEQNTFSEQFISQDAPIANTSTRTALL